MPATSSGEFICNQKDCLKYAPDLTTLKKHKHCNKPDFNFEHASKIIFYHSQRAFIPDGFENTAIRVDKRHNVAVCIARQLFIPKDDIKLHTELCSYCHVSHFNDEELDGIKNELDLSYMYTLWSLRDHQDFSIDSLPWPVLGSKRALSDLCLECAATRWVGVAPTENSQTDHIENFHSFKSEEIEFIRCFFSAINVGSKLVMFPTCTPCDEPNFYENVNILDDDELGSINDSDLEVIEASGAKDEDSDVQDLRWRDLYDDWAEILVTSDDEESEDGEVTIDRITRTGRRSTSRGSMRMDVGLEEQDDQGDIDMPDQEYEKSEDDEPLRPTNASRRRSEIRATPSPSPSKSPSPTPSSPLLEHHSGISEMEPESADKLVNALTERSPETDLLNKAASIAFQYYQCLLLDVFDYSRLDKLEFAGVRPFKTDPERFLHIREFVELILTIVRGYLNNDRLQSTSKQRQSIRDFLESVELVNLQEAVEKTALEDYQNVLYESLKDKLDFKSKKKSELRFDIALEFADTALFGYDDENLENTLRKFHEFMIYLLCEEQTRENYTKWNLITTSLVLQLQNNKKDQVITSIRTIDCTIYSMKLVAMRMVMESCDSSFSTCQINPWYQFVLTSRDQLFFVPIYSLHDEMVRIAGGRFKVNNKVIEGRIFEKDRLEAQIGDIIRSLRLGMQMDSFDKHHVIIKKLQEHVAIIKHFDNCFLENWESTSKVRKYVLDEIRNAFIEEGMDPGDSPLFAPYVDDKRAEHLITLFHSLERTLEELATLIFMTSVEPLAPEELLSWTYNAIPNGTSSSSSSSSPSIRVNGTRILMNQKYNLPWIASELLLQHLAVPRRLQLEIVRQLRKTIYAYQFSRTLEFNLEHYIFVGVNGRWSVSDFATTMSFVTLQCTGTAITPLVWLSGFESCGPLIKWKKFGKKMYKDMNGCTLLKRSG